MIREILETTVVIFTLLFCMYMLFLIAIPFLIISLILSVFIWMASKWQTEVINKLGHYIFKRICKDQEQLRKKQSMNIYGLYIRPSDIQRYIYDYTNYGIDYTGDDNISAEDMIDKYWDDRDEDL